MKKYFNFILVALIVFNLIVPLTVYAEKITKKYYRYDGYTIKYEVVDSWENNQNINVTISNTSNNSIAGWALKYDTGGEIRDLWNGIVYSTYETEYIIKNSGYNFEIIPDSSVTFGYILNGENLIIPDKIEICSHRINKKEGYEVNFIKTNDWEKGFQAEIEIFNLSNKPIEAWTLNFDSNFNIEELWNAKLISKNTNTYEVANQQWITPIQLNTSVSFGITASIDENIEPTIENIILTEVVIDETFDKIESDDENDGIYCKDVLNDDEISYIGNGVGYVKNQLLIIVDDSVSFQEMTDISDNLNAEIVGYIDILNEYQVEFKMDTDLSYLNKIINELHQYQFIEYVTLNYTFETQTSSQNTEFFPNDKYLGLDKGIDTPNWNLYAINVFRAWGFYPEMSTVNIGIIDNMFYKHTDLNFKKIWNNPAEILLSQYHGTHVAGIMAANFNNNEGIAGICPKNNLYAYAFVDTDTNLKKNLMIYQTALSKLIKKNVKVINISMAFGTSVRSSLMANDIETQEIVDECIEVLEIAFHKSFKKGYDFVIVTAAGNDDVEAERCSFFNYIDDACIKNHIIVVGSIGHTNESKSEYCFYNTSNWGNRVDVVAPGVDILSTDPYNSYYWEYMTGTSMAAPHISGIAGMMYSVNRSITGTEVKAIIKGTSKLRTVSDIHGFEYGIADAKLAVSTTYYYNENNPNKIIFGKLEDPDDTSKIFNNIEIAVSYKYLGKLQNQYIYSDDNGEFEIVIPKDVETLSLNYKIEGYAVTNADLLAEFLRSTAVVNLKLTPIEITVKGKVEVYNKTTKVTKPVANHTVVIYSEEQPDSVIAKGITNANGEYEIKFSKQGDFIVWFSDKKQSKFYAYNGEYIFDARFDTDDEDSDKDNNNTDDNNDWEKNDDSGNEISDINIDFDGTDDTSYTGDYSGNLSDGIWLTTSNGQDNYYVHIYTTSDKGEFRSTFGSPGFGLYTSTYHHWAHELKMATYRSNGTLIYDTRLDYFYDAIYIALYGSTPLMQIDAITSATINSKGITYNMHTDGYYKAFSNFIGSTGVREENWEKDVPKTVTFYNNSKCTGASSQKPF